MAEIRTDSLEETPQKNLGKRSETNHIHTYIPTYMRADFEPFSTVAMSSE